MCTAAQLMQLVEEMLYKRTYYSITKFYAQNNINIITVVMKQQFYLYLTLHVFQLGTVHISDSHRQHIQSILLEGTEDNAEEFPHDDSGDSQFQRDFLKHINGNIYEKLSNSVAIKQDKNRDLLLYLALKAKERNDVIYKKMQTTRKKLPSYEKRNDILDLLKRNQVMLISGETGCGKTTQVGQFILDDFIKQKKGSLCRIICTQPRRISALSVAARVAEERAEPLGYSVGYHIRLEK